MGCMSMIKYSGPSTTRTDSVALLIGSFSILAALSTGCSSDEIDANPNQVPSDASLNDAPKDARAADVSSNDSSSPDVALRDGSSPDAGFSDVNTSDVLSSDVSSNDGPSGDAGDDGAYDDLSRYVQDNVAKVQGASASIALLDGDKIVWSAAFGAPDDKGKSPTTDTMYAIASSSKMFVTVAIMKLVDAGKIGLDQPLTTYLPSFRMASPAYRYITVRMLLNHSAGFPGTDFSNVTTEAYNGGYSQQVLNTLASARLKHNPGQINVYCNDCFTVAEKVVEAVSGQSYAEFLKKEILEPLEMSHTMAPITGLPAGSYYSRSVDGANWSPYISNCIGAGGLYSTPSDLLRFAKIFTGAAANAKVLSAQSVEAMGKDETIGKLTITNNNFFRYGLGWDSISEFGLATVDKKAWSKDGAVSVYNSTIVVAPDDKLAVAVTSTGLSSVYHGIAQRALLTALVQKGKLTSLPSPNALKNAPESTASSDVLKDIPGYYASSSTFYKVQVRSNGYLDTSTLGSNGWTSTNTPRKYRNNGSFEPDGDSGSGWSFVSAGGKQYIVSRTANGYLNVPVELSDRQKLSSPGVMTAAWTNRLGKIWVLVNENANSAGWYGGAMASIVLTAEPELRGVLVANYSLVFDATVDDRQARTMLLMPPMAGRDICDFNIENRQGEEWLRYCNYRFRPVDSIPVLDAATSVTATVPAEDTAVWYRIGTALSGAKLTVSGPAKGKWVVCDASFAGKPSNITGTTWPVQIDGTAKYLVLIGEGTNSFSISTAP